MRRIVTPSQTVGPFFHQGMRPVEPLAGGEVPGERISVRGYVLDGQGQPVPDAVLETWQANHRGKYAHPEDTQDKQTTPGFSGYGRIFTDREGAFRIETIRPGPVPGPNGGEQAAHIMVTVMARGLLRQLVTRVYFADDPALAADPILQHVRDEGRRQTLLAQPDPREQGTYHWNVVLQGVEETVFFDV